jgi:UDPglucose--hexose-1-phosphate uridylyltransferase
MATERCDEGLPGRDGKQAVAREDIEPAFRSSGPCLRTDVLTGQQIVVAECRSQRPVTLTHSTPAPPADDDPFMEGRETLTPGETLALRAADSKPNEPGWLLRVVPNQYPAAESSVVIPSERRETSEVFSSRSVRGIHEVVVECPDYRSRLSDLTIGEVARILYAWQRRVRTLAAFPWVKAISVFRNEGMGAGASLPHCHSQILATDFIGNRIARLISRAQQSREETGRCIVGQWLSSELSCDQRVLRQGRHFATVCPFASRFPWQCRIVPLAVSRFDLLSAEQIRSLAAELHSATSAVQAVAGNVAHNVILTLPPTTTPEAFWWHLDLLPRPSRMAGFEFATGVDILAVSPETAVAQMREHLPAVPRLCDTDALCPDGFAWLADVTGG